MDERSETPQERQRPRVVDKRVSAGGEASEATRPPPEPSPQGPEGASSRDPDPSPQEQGTPTGSGEQVWTPEQEAQARAMAEEMARTPSERWVVEISLHLVQVAASKLDLGDPQDASLAIDALAAIVKGVGPRLGEAEAPLKQTLAQLQMAYAQSAAPPPGT